MTMGKDWLAEILGTDRLEALQTEASRRKLTSSLAATSDYPPMDAHEFELGAMAHEVHAHRLLGGDSDDGNLKVACADAYALACTLDLPEEPMARAERLFRIACLGVLGDRGPDARRLLVRVGIPALDASQSDWGRRTWAVVLQIWLLLIRKDGWDDLERVQHLVIDLRQRQAEFEEEYLEGCDSFHAGREAWRLAASYHLAKAAEILAVFLSQGEYEGHYDIQQQLESHMDRALAAAISSSSPDFEVFVRLAAPLSELLVRNSVWTATRAVNSRVTRFVRQIVRRSRPLFEMLPPQRRTLREEGLLGSSHRSVVVSLPTSSGKTLIAQFRILQALNQFDEDRGWVAYLAPTRALVNQVSVRLRSDFAPLGISVERVSPALEIDSVEQDLLTDADLTTQFRVLVATPEKLDLMIRSGWEATIKRPLTLVVVDEAHNLGNPTRGLRLELLLATINRDCRYAQFLLLTPFLRNAGEIARWLDPGSCKGIDLGVEWSPNERAIAVAIPRKTSEPSSFVVELRTEYTDKGTLSIPGSLEVLPDETTGLTWSQVSRFPGKLAAAVAAASRRRGTVIVVADTPGHTWGIAELLKTPGSRASDPSGELEAAKEFFAEEFGKSYPLADLLDYGVSVHHGGLSEDARSVVEWLTEKGRIGALVATTTVAQGLNFPVSGIILSARHYPRAGEMPPQDFWNIAGRAGRVDQSELGLVALCATNEDKAEEARRFVHRAVGMLTSTLVGMVQNAVRTGQILSLDTLHWQPEWSSFLQYLAHAYRQLGDYDRFVTEIEQILRGTLGFQTLRRTNPDWADKLVVGVHSYASRLVGQPLTLVDSTGFSLESIMEVLYDVDRERLGVSSWTTDLFSSRRTVLAQMMGVLLRVPELRQNLQDVFAGSSRPGESLACVLSDWVLGRSLEDISREYFMQPRGKAKEPREAMTQCCQRLFGKVIPTASWGLSALQALTMRGRSGHAEPVDERSVRNLPARLYYGVNSDAAVSLRLLGVPRTAAAPLAKAIEVRDKEPLSALRARLHSLGDGPWVQSLGSKGTSYSRIWTVIEGTGRIPQESPR